MYLLPPEEQQAGQQTAAEPAWVDTAAGEQEQLRTPKRAAHDGQVMATGSGEEEDASCCEPPAVGKAGSVPAGKEVELTPALRGAVPTSASAAVPRVAGMGKAEQLAGGGAVNTTSKGLLAGTASEGWQRLVEDTAGGGAAAAASGGGCMSALAGAVVVQASAQEGAVTAAAGASAAAATIATAAAGASGAAATIATAAAGASAAAATIATAAAGASGVAATIATAAAGASGAAGSGGGGQQAQPFSTGVGAVSDVGGPQMGQSQLEQVGGAMGWWIAWGIRGKLPSESSYAKGEKQSKAKGAKQSGSGGTVTGVLVVCPAGST